jgi:hypothetical protein
VAVYILDSRKDSVRNLGIFAEVGPVRLRSVMSGLCTGAAHLPVPFHSFIRSMDEVGLIGLGYFRLS